MKYLKTYEAHMNKDNKLLSRRELIDKIRDWMNDNRLVELDITDWNIKEGKVPIYTIYIENDVLKVSSVQKRGEAETPISFFGLVVMRKIWEKISQMTEDDIDDARAGNEADKFNF